MASPIPRLAPVTTAALPASSKSKSEVIRDTAFPKVIFPDLPTVSGTHSNPDGSTPARLFHEPPSLVAGIILRGLDNSVDRTYV
jgi:hypothetical protein